MHLPDLIEIKNGKPAKGTFSDEEYERRKTQLRSIMVVHGIDTVLFTSFHNICYYADFIYCAFGRHYGLVVDGDRMVSISANIDGGQPWRRTRGHENLVYTDWQKGNFFRAVQALIKDGDTVGIEFDTVSLDTKAALVKAFPNSRFVDIASSAMAARMIKSEEEIEHIKKMAKIADLGGDVCRKAISPGVAEFEIASHARAKMVEEIARVWPDSELMDTWVWLQSGINTDGAHNPLTTRKIQQGDILSINTFPMVSGYYIALERTMFCGKPSDAHLR
ncbi:MAG: aminopeptidase P family N-terminal domain-containing protein, partial [Fimbriimonadaceae bacterium]|nr:aminopeptidase P family N-terminal domain-containing protein [Alphaproteobacteria bacterium]